MICRGLCACTEMVWMCVLYVSFWSKVDPHTPILWDEPLLSMSDYVNGYKSIFLIFWDFSKKIIHFSSHNFLIY